MAFSWKKYPRPIVALAPIAGWTDSPYRQIVKKLAPEIVCFSELTSTNAIKHENEKTMRMLDFAAGEYPLIMQLFGKNPDFFVEAGKKLEQLGVAGIDINMGCPARKVTHAKQGAALIKDQCLAAEIVHKLSRAIKIPVSVKTRLGYDKYDPERLIGFAKDMQNAGASLLTLHGRTTRQAFSGQADWTPIYEVKKTLKIPVIGNGDITSAEIAISRLHSPDDKVILDGIMVGRATFGNPWIIAEIYAKLHGNQYQSPQTLREKIPLIREHLEISLKMKGERYSITEMRKHFGAYIKGFEGASEFRQRIMQTHNTGQIFQILTEIEKNI